MIPVVLRGKVDEPACIRWVEEPPHPVLDVRLGGEVRALSVVAARMGEDEIRKAVVDVSRPGDEVVDLGGRGADLAAAVEAAVRRQLA